MSDAYVIWSFEHDAWWRRAKWGYTQELAEAGRYPKDEAESIVFKANRHVKTPHEQAMLLSTAEVLVLYRQMPTLELQRLHAAFRLDVQDGADAAFCSVRLRLIEQVLNDRGTPVEVIE